MKNRADAPAWRPVRCELRFRSLYEPGRALAFPCDAEGRVDIERLSPAARENLWAARARVGLDFEEPQVVPAPEGPEPDLRGSG